MDGAFTPLRSSGNGERWLTSVPGGAVQVEDAAGSGVRSTGRANLPRQLTSFVGRDTEMAEVRNLLAHNRLVTLTGPGGSGKTRLALQIATAIADEYPDGVGWADLAPIADPDLVPRSVAAALSVPDLPFRSPLETLSFHLEDRTVLLVLDNCEHVIDACATLAGSILRSASHVRVLATGREPLGVEGETSWVVPPLELPGENGSESAEELLGCESVRLFADRAQKVRPNFRLTQESASAVAEICRRVDGMPLALELAAARIRVLTPEQIVEGLSDSLHMLAGGTRTALPRQQTLRASVEWSYELLGEQERVLLRRLSVFAGSFGLDAAEEVCSGDGIERLEVLDLLSKLVEKSLVRTEERADVARYRLLETIRQYAHERLLDFGEEQEGRDRHLAFFLERARVSAEEPDSGEAAWIARLEADNDNFRAAIDWAASSRKADAQLELASKLWPFWGVRHLGEGRSRLEAALATDGPDGEARGWALFGASILSSNLFDLASGASLAREALELSRRIGCRELEAAALGQLGWAYGWIEGPAARRYHEESIALAREIDDRWTLSLSLNGLGFLEFQSGRPKEARRLLEEALDVARHSDFGSVSPLRGVYGWLGLTLMLQGDLGEAKRNLTEALQGEETVGGAVFRSLWLSGLGQVATFSGEYEEARRLLDEALRITEEYGFPLGASVPLWFRGMLEYWTNDLATAHVTLERALQLLQASGETLKWGVSMCMAILGNIAWVEGDHEGGKAQLDEALRTAREAGIAAAEENALALRAIVAELEEDYESAEAMYRQAMTVAMEAGGRPWIADCLQGLGCLVAKLGSLKEAARMLGAAEAMRESIGYAQFPVYAEAYERDVVLVREGLTAEELGAAWAEGRAMSMEQAVLYASKGRGPRKRPSTGWASLTPVEREVANLVAERLTNPQIAERLFVSRGTVKTHLSNIYSKLRLRSRLDLADEVLKHRG